MNFEDRGGARLRKLLANPERAERVRQIQQQMREDDRALRNSSSESLSSDHRGDSDRPTSTS